jgi:hypothetical protein
MPEIIPDIFFTKCIKLRYLRIIREGVNKCYASYQNYNVALLWKQSKHLNTTGIGEN